MNKPKEYIKIKYTQNSGYKISIITDKETFYLNKKDAEIMYEVLKKFKPIPLNKEQTEKNKEENIKKEPKEVTYIYTNPMHIMINFYFERKKANKKPHINRQKSKAIVVSTISLAAITAVSGMLYLNSAKNKNNSSNYVSGITTENMTNNNDFYISNLQNNMNLITNEENIQTNESIEDFHYYYAEIGDKLALENAKKYDELFAKYEKKYGVDKELLCAIAAQESSGRQSATNYEKSYGLMGIEYIWADQTIKVYNFETENYETIKIDYEKVKNDAEYNIMIGSAIMQWHFDATINSGLIEETEVLAYSLQRYNMGSGRMQNIVATGVHWMEGRNFENEGDKRYFENVLSKLENGEVIEMRLRNGNYQSYRITNDALELESTHIKR